MHSNAYIWKDEVKPTAIFFWTPQKLQQNEITWSTFRWVTLPETNYDSSPLKMGGFQ